MAKFKIGQEVFFLAKEGFYRCKVYSVTIEDVRYPNPIYHLVGERFENEYATESEITDSYEHACSLYQ